MANHPESHAHGQGDHAAHAHGDHTAQYMKVYWLLLALFTVSVMGPVVAPHLANASGAKVIVLVTAFGIALVKAYLVAANFMHLKIEKRYIVYLMFTALAFMGLFYAGVSPDVMNHRGRQWENVAAQREVDRAMTKAATEGEHGAHGEEGEH